jgi:hypothetical protein
LKLTWPGKPVSASPVFFENFSPLSPATKHKRLFPFSLDSPEDKGADGTDSLFDFS